MKKSKLLTVTFVLIGLIFGAAGACAAAEKNAEQSKLEKKAKVSRVEAEKIALAKVPGGTVKEADIEKEGGKLLWSFDITTPGTADITEVQIDAKTGEVISIEKETPADQAKEKAADEKAEKPKKKK